MDGWFKPNFDHLQTYGDKDDEESTKKSTTGVM